MKEIASHEEDHMMTKFVDDSQVVTHEESSEHKSKVCLIRPQINPSIDTFVKRPITISNIKWKASDIGGSNLYTISPLMEWWKDAAVVKYLSNSAYIIPKKLKITIRVNATVQHYGLLVLGWVPSVFGSDVQYTMPQLFQTRHVVIIPSRKSVFEITIPFVSQFEMLPVDKDYFTDYCRIFLNVVVPLNSSNGVPSPVDVSTFVVMEDVELVALTSVFNTPVKPQGKRPYKREQEENSSASGNQTSFVQKIADTVNTVASMIPGVGEILGIVDYLFFDSPPSDISPSPMQMTTQRLGHIDGPVNTTVLGPSQNSLLDVDASVAMDCHHEGVFASFASREGYIGYTPITADTQAGTVLFSQVLSPLMLFSDSLNKTLIPPSEFVPTPLNYIGRLFNLWKSSFVFKIYPVMSSFHSVRLRFWYKPADTLGNNVVNDFQASIVYNTVVDLNADQPFEFVVPFIANKPFLQNVTEENPLLNSTNTSGTFGCTVVNELTSNEAAVTPISLIVMVRAGTDFQVAYPTLWHNKSMQWVNDYVKPQGSEFNDVIELGTSEGHVIKNGYNSTSIISSCKQLLALPSFIYNFSDKAAQTVKFNPYGTWKKGELSYDFMSRSFMYWLLPVFRFYRGSYRVAFQTVSAVPLANGEARYNVNSYKHWAKSSTDFSDIMLEWQDYRGFAPSGDLDNVLPNVSWNPSHSTFPDDTVNYDSDVKTARFLQYTPEKELSVAPPDLITNYFTETNTKQAIRLLAMMGDDLQLGFQMPCPIIKRSGF